MRIPAPSVQGPHPLSDRWAEGEHPPCRVSAAVLL